MSIRIVVVDDHQILRDGLILRLHQEVDFEVVGVAANSDEAYACIERTAPQLVIMDVHHPGEDGIVACARVHRMNPLIKILILTGAHDTDAAHEALLAGAQGFLRKEHASAELVHAVREVMAGRIYLSAESVTAVSLALVAKAAAPRRSVLTERELSVLKGLADGLSYKAIAHGLGISEKSVETYRARLVKKTGCATRAELVRYAVRKRIIVP